MADIIQVYILITSGLMVYYVKSPQVRQRKMGYWVGIIGEPAWVYSTLTNQQYGMFLLSLWYTFNFILGLFYLRNQEEKE